VQCVDRSECDGVRRCQVWGPISTGSREEKVDGCGVACEDATGERKNVQVFSQWGPEPYPNDHPLINASAAAYKYEWWVSTRFRSLVSGVVLDAS
jgi:hypothetical protein